MPEPITARLRRFDRPAERSPPRAALLTALPRPPRRPPSLAPALLAAAAVALLASPAAAAAAAAAAATAAAGAAAAPPRATNASATPSWLAVGPSAAAGSFDLFNLNSQGQKTKVLVTFPVDADEVAQDGAFGCGRGYCMMLTQLPAAKQTILRNFSFFSPALLGKYTLPYLAYNLNVNEAEADDDFYGECDETLSQHPPSALERGGAGAQRSADGHAPNTERARHQRVLRLTSVLPSLQASRSSRITPRRPPRGSWRTWVTAARRRPSSTSPRTWAPWAPSCRARRPTAARPAPTPRSTSPSRGAAPAAAPRTRC